MKTTLLAFILTIGAYAQETPPNKTTPPIKDYNDPDSIQYNYPDGYMMKNGKMMEIKNGKMSRMKKDVTLMNGTVVMTSGSYRNKGEQQIPFTEGQHINMRGEITLRKTQKGFYDNEDLDSREKKNRLLPPDSTMKQ